MNTLDLHGTKHADVFRKVDHFVGHHIQRGTRGEIEIITGFSKKMKSLVNEVLADYGLESEEAWMNEGKLIIKM